MKRVVSQMKRTLSMVLAFMMVATAIPQTAMTVLADEADEIVFDEVEAVEDAVVIDFAITGDVAVKEVTGVSVNKISDVKYSVSANTPAAVELTYDETKVDVTVKKGDEAVTVTDKKFDVAATATNVTYAITATAIEPAREYKTTTKIKTKAQNKTVYVTNRRDSYGNIHEDIVATTTFPIVDVTLEGSNEIVKAEDVSIVNKDTGAALSGNWNLEITSVSNNGINVSTIIVAPTDVDQVEADNVTYTMTISGYNENGEAYIQKNVDFKVSYVKSNGYMGFYSYYPTATVYKEIGSNKKPKSSKPVAYYLGKKTSAKYEFDEDRANDVAKKAYANGDVTVAATGVVTVAKTYSISGNLVIPVKAKYKKYDKFTDDIAVTITTTDLATELETVNNKIVAKLVEYDSTNDVFKSVSENSTISIDDTKQYYAVALNKGVSVNAAEYTRGDLYSMVSNRIRFTTSSKAIGLGYDYDTFDDILRVYPKAAATSVKLNVAPADGSTTAKKNTFKFKVAFASAEEFIDKLEVKINDYFNGTEPSISGNKISYNGAPYAAVQVAVSDTIEGKPLNVSNYNFDIKVAPSTVISKGKYNGVPYVTYVLKGRKEAVTVTIKDKVSGKKKVITIDYTNPAAKISANKVKKIKVAEPLVAGSYAKGQTLKLDLTNAKLGNGAIPDGSFLQFSFDEVAYSKDKKGAYNAFDKAIAENWYATVSGNSAEYAIAPNKGILAGNIKGYITVFDKTTFEPISAPLAVTIKTNKVKVKKVKVALAASTTIDYKTKKVSSNTIAFKKAETVSDNSVASFHVTFSNAQVKVSGNKITNKFTEAFEFEDLKMENGKPVSITVKVKDEKLAQDKNNKTGYVVITSNAGLIEKPYDISVGKRVYVQKITVNYKWK